LPQSTKQGNWSADENTQTGSLNTNPNQTRRITAEGYVKQSIYSSQFNSAQLKYFLFTHGVIYEEAFTVITEQRPKN
jgi:hypothetical protein